MARAPRWSCWAINSNSREGHGFLGILCWFEGGPSRLPSHVCGNRTATWRTRSEARAALRTLKAQGNVFPRAAVQRVLVRVEGA